MERSGCSTASTTDQKNKGKEQLQAAAESWRMMNYRQTGRPGGSLLLPAGNGSAGGGFVVGGSGGGCFPWPPRSYSCSFCKREFKSAQALGGHMNVHRRDKARLRQSPPYSIYELNPNPNPAATSKPPLLVLPRTSSRVRVSIPNLNMPPPPNSTTSSSSGSDHEEIILTTTTTTPFSSIISTTPLLPAPKEDQDHDLDDMKTDGIRKVLEVGTDLFTGSNNNHHHGSSLDLELRLGYMH